MTTCTTKDRPNDNVLSLRQLQCLLVFVTFLVLSCQTLLPFQLPSCASSSRVLSSPLQIELTGPYKDNERTLKHKRLCNEL